MIRKITTRIQNPESDDVIGTRNNGDEVLGSRRFFLKRGLGIAGVGLAAILVGCGDDEEEPIVTGGEGAEDPGEDPSIEEETGLDDPDEDD